MERMNGNHRPAPRLEKIRSDPARSMNSTASTYASYTRALSNKEILFRNYYRASTIHGTRHILSRGYRWHRRLFWIVAFVLLAGIMIYLLYEIIAEYVEDNQITYQRKHRYTSLPAPAIYVCSYTFLNFTQLATTNSFHTWAGGVLKKSGPAASWTFSTEDFNAILTSHEEEFQVNFFRSYKQHVYPTATILTHCNNGGSSCISAAEVSAQGNGLPCLLVNKDLAMTLSDGKVLRVKIQMPSIALGNNHKILELHLKSVASLIGASAGPVLAPNTMNKFGLRRQKDLISLGECSTEERLTFYQQYTPEVCQRECGIRKFFDVCGCNWPFLEETYYKKECTYQEYMFCVHSQKVLTAPCDCLEACETTTYTFQQSAIPIQGTGTNESVDLEIYYSSMSETVTEIRRSYTTAHLIGAIGGIISIFLGFSFMSCVEILDLLFRCCGECVDEGCGCCDSGDERQEYANTDYWVNRIRRDHNIELEPKATGSKESADEHPALQY